MQIISLLTKFCENPIRGSGGMSFRMSDFWCASMFDGRRCHFGKPFTEQLYMIITCMESLVSCLYPESTIMLKYEDLTCRGQKQVRRAWSVTCGYAQRLETRPRDLSGSVSARPYTSLSLCHSHCPRSGQCDKCPPFSSSIISINSRHSAL